MKRSKLVLWTFCVIHNCLTVWLVNLSRPVEFLHWRPKDGSKQRQTDHKGGAERAAREWLRIVIPHLAAVARGHWRTTECNSVHNKNTQTHVQANTYGASQVNRWLRQQGTDRRCLVKANLTSITLFCFPKSPAPKVTNAPSDSRSHASFRDLKRKQTEQEKKLLRICCAVKARSTSFTGNLNLCTQF